MFMGSSQDSRVDGEKESFSIGQPCSWFVSNYCEFEVQARTFMAFLYKQHVP